MADRLSTPAPLPPAELERYREHLRLQGVAFKQAVEAERKGFDMRSLIQREITTVRTAMAELATRLTRYTGDFPNRASWATTLRDFDPGKQISVINRPSLDCSAVHEVIDSLSKFRLCRPTMLATPEALHMLLVYIIQAETCFRAMAQEFNLSRHVCGLMTTLHLDIRHAYEVSRRFSSLVLASELLGEPISDERRDSLRRDIDAQVASERSTVMQDPLVQTKTLYHPSMGTAISKEHVYKVLLGD